MYQMRGKGQEDECLIDDAWSGLEDEYLQQESVENEFISTGESISIERGVRLVEEWLTTGKSLRELQHTSKESLEYLYSIAYKFYVAKQYEKAVYCFRFLNVWDHQEPKYLLGLAGSYQGLQCYEQALQCYGALSFLEYVSAQVSLNMGVCHMALHNYEEAQQNFNTVRSMLQGKHTHKNILKRATVLFNRVEEIKKRKQS